MLEISIDERKAIVTKWQKWHIPEVSTGVRSSSKGLSPWEYKVRLNAVSYESEHSNTSVLDLRLTKESNGSFISLSPEILICERKRIIESYSGVTLGSKSLKVSLGGGESFLGSRRCIGGECGGTSEDGGKDCELHF